MEESYYYTIEILSSELWREIFDYFNGIELWHSFRGLNQKIDSIIDQTLLHFNFKKTGNYTYFIKNILSTISINNIQSLKLSHINKTKHFFSICSLDSMINLRILSLNQMFSFNDNTFVFWNQFSSLTYLQFLKINILDKDGRGNSDEEIDFIIHSIFNKNFCPLLKSFSIGSNRNDRKMRKIPSLIQTTNTTHIQYFSIDRLIFNDFSKLFPALKNVKSFNVNFEFDFERNCNEQLQNIPISIPLLPKCIQMNLNVGDYVYFKHIVFLLKNTPNLKDLSLKIYYYYLLDGKEWETILSSQCPKLIKFNLRCVGYDDDTDYAQTAEDFNKRCNKNSFWLERNTVYSEEAFGNEPDHYHVVIQFNIKKVCFPLYMNYYDLSF